MRPFQLRVRELGNGEEECQTSGTGIGLSLNSMLNLVCNAAKSA